MPRASAANSGVPLTARSRGRPKAAFRGHDTNLTSQIGILAGNPHPNAARPWTNRMLSREAQLAQFVAGGSPPSHKALQTSDFLVYVDPTVGRRLVQADERYTREVFEMWDRYWR